MSFEEIFLNTISELENGIISEVSSFIDAKDIEKIIKILKIKCEENIKYLFKSIKEDGEIVNLRTLLESCRF